MEYIKIISGVLAIFIGYHKFILSLLDRKIDKEIWEREKKPVSYTHLTLPTT